jgi:hypothetical protein
MQIRISRLPSVHQSVLVHIPMKHRYTKVCKKWLHCYLCVSMLSYIQRTSGTVSPQANQVELAFANLINEVFYDKKKDESGLSDRSLAARRARH